MSKIGIISDTHGQVTRVQQAVIHFDKHEIDTVLHCGDIESLAIPAILRPSPAHFVLGNVDWNSDALAAAIKAAGHLFHGRFGALQIGGRSIALLHGDNARQLSSVTESGEWDVVCTGHTHHPNVQRDGNTVVLNPGALHRAVRYTIAVLDLADLSVEFIELD